MAETIQTIQMTDLIRLRITNYFTFKSYATVLNVETGEVDPKKCYVKLKINLDYYIHDPNYHAIDIDFKNCVINGFLDLSALDR